ncbi:hypothetical protein [Streptomyces sp. KL116D]|uniref:hypothetical protein n=1 Tax=Streptomyces sp. KL116D TaxID=3045152 RepID=UPI003557B4E4
MPDGARAVLAAAAQRWDLIAGQLSPAAKGRLAVLLTGVRDGERDAARQAALVLADELPDEFGGPQAARFAPALAGPELHVVQGEVTIGGFVADDLAALVVDGHRMVGPVLGPVRRRLLAEPAYDAGEVRQRDEPRLIRLRGPGGRTRLPRFQFTADAVPLPVVLDANTVLGADRDPWGAADWWLSANAWLSGGARPADLIGTADARLLDAVRLLTEDDY